MIFKREAKAFVLGCCFMTAVLSAYLFFTNNLPFMQAAGVGTGAPDINAKYLDGYGTATTSTSSKVYISDASGYLPDSSVDSGAIINGAIDIGHIATDAVGSDEIATDAVGSDEIAANSVGDSEMSVGYTWPDDIVCGSGFTNMGTYCIQTDENSATDWYSASDYCYDTYGARLCTSSEWYNACMNGGLTNIIDDEEWVDTWYTSLRSIVRGNGSCDTAYAREATSTSEVFRCCK